MLDHEEWEALERMKQSDDPDKRVIAGVLLRLLAERNQQEQLDIEANWYGEDT